MSRLNRDILSLIFTRLQCDSKSLYSSLLVNRLWLECAIPILWKDPWYNEVKRIDYRYKLSLYYVITFLLSDDVKKSLTIGLPPTFYQSLLFDYLSFCESINVDVINKITSIGASTCYKQFILQQEIYALFMRKIPESKYLDMRSIKHQIFYFPGAEARLKTLCEIKFDTFIDHSFFYGLSQICQDIQRITIFHTSVKANCGIIRLIEVQRNLKFFEWKDDLDLDFVNNISHDEIFLALKKKADTLLHLVTNFHNCHYIINNNDNSLIHRNDYIFPPLILPELHNLKTLKFNSPLFTRTNYECQLKRSFFHSIEILQIDYIEIGTIMCLIKNSGKSLRKILIKKFIYDVQDEHFWDESLLFIRIICENCPLIEYLSIVFPPSKSHYAEFENLLKSCQRLEALSLILEYINNRCNDNLFEQKKLESVVKLSDILIRFAPIKLRVINDFRFSPKTLREVLEDWKGLPTFSILISNPDYHEEEYVRIIERYKRYIRYPSSYGL